MEVALRECIATALWNANVKTGLRVSIVTLIQNVMMELFRKTHSNVLRLGPER
jgi:hypothetical protein